MTPARARDIGRNIRYARWIVGITATNLARRAGHPQSAISAWEAGIRLPTARAMSDVAIALGVPVADLWDGPPFKGSAP